MDNYQIAVIVLAVLGGVWGIISGTAKVITPLIKQLTEVNANMLNLSERLKNLTEQNSKSHQRLWDRVEGHEETLQDHEKRICKMECKEE